MAVDPWESHHWEQVGETASENVEKRGCGGRLWGAAILLVVLLALSYYLYSTGFLDALLEQIMMRGP